MGKQDAYGIFNDVAKGEMLERRCQEVEIYEWSKGNVFYEPERGGQVRR